jgi:uncharacterized membrane protein HdeD (DUF308 family)
MQPAVHFSFDGRLNRYTRISGWVLVILGLIGILLPQFVSVTLAVMVGWLLLLAAGISTYQVYHAYRRNGLAWLKPFVLFCIGSLIVFKPTVAIAALGLLLALYFLMNGFAGVSFALELRPLGGWGWILANGLLSFLLAAILLFGWYQPSPGRTRAADPGTRNIAVNRRPAAGDPI